MTTYAVIGAPPLATGAVQCTVAPPLRGAADGLPGALGVRLVVIRPIEPPDESPEVVNQNAPSGPAVIANGPSDWLEGEPVAR